MPNWVINDLSIDGPPESVKRLLEKGFGSQPPRKISELEKEFRSLEEEDNEPYPMNLHLLVPLPSEVYNFTYAGEEEEKNGVKVPLTQYDAEVNYWGCKWGISELSKTQEELLADSEWGIVCVRFQTAWSPPIKAFESISRDFPDLSFHLIYRDEFLNFSGDSCFTNGKVETYKNIRTKVD